MCQACRKRCHQAAFGENANYVSMCLLSSVQYVQLHCFSRPKSARQSRLAPARPLTHAHIPLNLLKHTHTHTDIYRHFFKKTYLHTQLLTVSIVWLEPRGVKQDLFQPEERMTFRGRAQRVGWRKTTHRSPAESVFWQEL